MHRMPRRKLIPTDEGLADDVLAPLRGTIEAVSAAINGVTSLAIDALTTTADSTKFMEDFMDGGFDLTIAGLDGQELITEEVNKLGPLVRQAYIKQTALNTQSAALQESMGKYQQALADGQRIIEDRLRFRQQTAAQIQQYRYQDMTYRTFRNDALQKYQAQFDLAAKYVYMTAKAYDYETNQLGDGGLAGEQFLTNVVSSCSLGVFDSNGNPETGGTDGGDPGLASVMAQMKQNFDLVLGLNSGSTIRKRKPTGSACGTACSVRRCPRAKARARARPATPCGGRTCGRWWWTISSRCRNTRSTARPYRTPTPRNRGS